MTFKVLKIFLISILLVILGYLVFLGICYGRDAYGIYTHARDGERHLTMAQGSFKEMKFKEVSNSLTKAQIDFEKASTSLSKFDRLKSIPGFKAQIDSLDHLLKGGDFLCSGLKKTADALFSIINPIDGSFDNLFIQFGTNEKKLVLAELENSTMILKEAKFLIDQADYEIDKISKKGTMGEILEAREKIKNVIPSVKNALDYIILGSELLPDALGYPEGKTYLFLFKNNTELRPAGGFIGSYGILEVKNGALEKFTTSGVYKIDRGVTTGVPTPKPMQLYNRVYDWAFRDSNWSPDFIASAEKSEWFYKIQGGEENFDGVIAITPDLLVSFIKLTGPIEIPGYPYTFTSENFIDELQYHVEINYKKLGINSRHRKDILNDLSFEIIKEVLGLPKEKIGDLIKIIKEELDRKQILLYFHDEKIANIVKEQNWSGEVKIAPSDYVLWVDANLAALKTDVVMERKLSYQLETQNSGRIKAKVTMHYKNNGSFTWRTTRYRSYARVYVPLGSEFIRCIGGRQDITDTGIDLGKTWFGDFIQIEPQEARTLTFEYYLPDTVSETIRNNEYGLLIQKQCGTKDYDLDVDLSFPKKITSFEPKNRGKLENENEVKFDWDLGQDRESKVNF